MACCTARTAFRVAAAFMVVAAGAAAWQLWPKRMPPPAWANDYDVTARTPDTLPAGTVHGSTPPEGWSHIVIKSLPRVKPSEISRVPNNALIGRSGSVRMATWMFTAFVADVRPETRGSETRHHLRAIALGLGTSINGQDVIITPETATQHGAEMSWITDTILKKGYETQRLAVIVIHGPTFALVDCPVWFHCGEKNRLIRYRYALLVDAPTGRLDVLLWMLDPEGGCADTNTAELLPPNLVDTPELVPDPKEFNTVGIPSDAGFGVDKLPPGRARITFPAALRDLTTKTRFTPDEAAKLEHELRRLVVP